MVSKSILSHSLGTALAWQIIQDSYQKLRSSSYNAKKAEQLIEFIITSLIVVVSASYVGVESIRVVLVVVVIAVVAACSVECNTSESSDALSVSSTLSMLLPMPVLTLIDNFA